MSLGSLRSCPWNFICSSSDPSIFKLMPTSRKEAIIWFGLSHMVFQDFQRALVSLTRNSPLISLTRKSPRIEWFFDDLKGNYKITRISKGNYMRNWTIWKGYTLSFFSKNNKNDHFEKGTPILFYQKLFSLKRKIFQKKRWLGLMKSLAQKI